MDKNLKDITYFISFCIEQYMNEKGINEDEVISIFSEYGVFDYLKDYFYEIIPYLAGLSGAQPVYKTCITVAAANNRSALEMASLGI